MKKINRRGHTNSDPLQHVTHYTFTLYILHQHPLGLDLQNSFSFFFCLNRRRRRRRCCRRHCYSFYQFFLSLAACTSVCCGAFSKSDSVLCFFAFSSPYVLQSVNGRGGGVVAVYGPINIAQNVVHIIIATRRFFFSFYFDVILAHLHNGSIWLLLLPPYVSGCGTRTTF